MSNKAKRILRRTVIALLLLIIGAGTGLIVFSPYGNKEGLAYKAVITIAARDAPDSVVFKNVANSAHASDWSTFVDHITPLNPEVKNDGEPGSVRRVFRQADEKRMTWDELITLVEPNRRRQLTIYDIKNAEMDAHG